MARKIYLVNPRGDHPSYFNAEVMAEARLSPEHILQGIERFARERGSRLKTLRDVVAAVERRGD